MSLKGEEGEKAFKSATYRKKALQDWKLIQKFLHC